MRHLRKLLPLLGLGVLACVLLCVPALAVEEGEAAPMLYGTWWALVPPVVAIVLALITKEAYSSLFIGVLMGAFLASDFHPVHTLDTIVQKGLITAIGDNAGIFVFLVLLGTIVALVNAAGGSAAFGRWAEENIRTKVGAQLATFVLGILIFIDDYFNCLTVGSVMRPVTDRHRISRTKLAFLIDATAAPVCMIAPVSSWAAAVSGTAEGLDTGISGIQLFIRAIPYNLYSLLTFVFILLLVLLRFDYGPMRRFERRARRGDLGALPGSAEETGNEDGLVADLVLPVLILIAVCTLGMLYVGGFFGTDWWGESGYQWDFIGAFGNTDAFVGLPWGSIIALIVIVAYLTIRGRVGFKEAMACIPKGFDAMVPAITILTLAVSLKNMTNGELGAAVFVGDAMTRAAPGLADFLPAVIFLVACVLAFASGTSWGTFGILIPIVTAIFSPDSPLMIIGISACLAGAVCGDHCSPISDTTIMASAGAQVEHVDHVSTQLPYAITVAAVSFVGFLVAGRYQDLYLTWGVSVALLAAVLLILRVVVLFLDRRDRKNGTPDDETAPDTPDAPETGPAPSDGPKDAAPALTDKAPDTGSASGDGNDDSNDDDADDDDGDDEGAVPEEGTALSEEAPPDAPVSPVTVEDVQAVFAEEAAPAVDAETVPVVPVDEAAPVEDGETVPVVPVDEAAPVEDDETVPVVPVEDAAPVEDGETVPVVPVDEAAPVEDGETVPVVPVEDAAPVEDGEAVPVVPVDEAAPVVDADTFPDEPVLTEDVDVPMEDEAAPMTGEEGIPVVSPVLLEDAGAATDGTSDTDPAEGTASDGDTDGAPAGTVPWRPDMRPEE